MRKRFQVFPELFILLCCWGGEGNTTVSAQTSQANTKTEERAHLVVNVRGQASVKRKGWSQYTPVLVGASLRTGDSLRVEGASQVKVLCADFTVSDALTGIASVPCSMKGKERLVFKHRGDFVISTRGGGTGLFPMIISPRKTTVLNPQPLLRWTPLAGAQRYQVTVRGGGLDWSASVIKNELLYPDSAPRLKEKTFYKLVVSANEHHSDEEPGVERGFTVLPSGEAKKVRKEEEQIRQFGLPDVSTRLLIAYLYLNHDLKADAIDQLEGAPKNSDSSQPALKRLLGDLYGTIGLVTYAEESYLTALSLSERASDEEGQMLTHQALGRIYNQRGNYSLVAKHLRAALELSKKLGDQDTTKLIEADLSRIK